LTRTKQFQGAVVDSSALAEALEKGQIFAAGVDVVDGEPNVSADHPLARQQRCVVLPHIGSATWDAREGMAMLCE
jgi:glyoxylate/hydroxypyruvate reductase